VETKSVADGTSFAILDAGINLAETVRYQYHQLLPVNRYGEAPDRTYRLVGPICSPGDILYDACPLPALRPGDSLAIMDAGAYFVPFATSFSFPQPAIVMVEDGRVRRLRRAETYEDLVLLDE
jgi:diaminopimelate decarboxylase